ncbi:hypothetical protein [Castellaniella ginsengisoli]|uniref:Uncharacterized protein n=1 Tax=Castellaniella ginsengisoli TaxID=546114 RepID=A0AB39EX02_9BURK
MMADYNVDSLSSDAVAQHTRVQIGTSECPDCFKLKTYTTAPIPGRSFRVVTPELTGWINVGFRLAVTNVTENHVPQYRLIANLTNNGAFINEVSFFVEGEDGEYVLLNSLNKYGMNCFSNIATGCSWKEEILLPIDRVDRALITDSPLNVLVGKVRSTRSKTSSDGYNVKYETSFKHYGVTLTIPPASLKGLQQAVIQDGSAIPSSAAVLAAEAKKENQELQRRAQIQAQKKIEKPFKFEIGTRICRQQGPWKITGYVEQAVKERIQIRISDMSDGNLRPGSFREAIIWDLPDNWDLC